MKIFKFLGIIILTVVILSSCHKEDTISVDEKEQYTFINEPTTETEQYIYDFYHKYNSLIVTNPDSSFYKFNFKQFNNIAIENSSWEDDELFRQAFNLTEYIISIYDDAFLKKYLPFTIQYTDKIYPKDNEGNILEDNVMDFYVSSNFIMLGEINKENFQSITQEQKKELAVNVNIDFWIKNIKNYRGAITFSESFSEKLTEVYKRRVGRPNTMSKEEALNKVREHGYLELSRHYLGLSSPDYRTPKEVEDLQDWFRLLLSKSESQIKEDFKDYPIILERYEIMKDIVKEGTGYEFNNFQ